MTGSKARRRGEPLAMLVLVLAGWTGVRLSIWESPFPPAPANILPELIGQVTQALSPAAVKAPSAA